MRVLLVSTWGTGCGIAEHSWYLKDSVKHADPSIEIVPCPEALDPVVALNMVQYESLKRFDVVHLNYQASLHSRWTPELIDAARSYGPKVVVTYHDTGVPNTEQCLALLDASDAAVVHEPIGDYPLDGKVHYWRMGVPEWQGPMQFADRGQAGQPRETAWKATPLDPPSVCFKDWQGQPVLGSIGFPFPWKHYDKLVELTRRIGWAILLLAPGASPAQVQQWREINPASYIRTDFVPRFEAGSLLSGCDATAFAYVCHNTGQSAAILQGIATRKPVHAFHTCRQFRALWDDRLGRTAISWCETFEELEFNLSHLTGITRQPYAPMVALAEQESWRKIGRKYATLYYEVERG